MSTQVSLEWDISKLSKNTDRSKFDCGDTELNNHFRKYAWQSHQINAGTTYIATLQPNKKVAGYYTISSASLCKEQLPEEMQKQMPKNPGATLLGRIAVDLEFQGKKLGKELLFHAMYNTYRISELAATCGLFARAKNEKAKEFYKHFEFTELINDEMTLILPISKIIKNFGD